jgi:DNA (cytosine-5)-methyltransferase 1
MGVPSNYPLPSKYNDAYHLFGDGLVVPVVAWLEKQLLRPLARSNSANQMSKQIA